MPSAWTSEETLLRKDFVTNEIFSCFSEKASLYEILNAIVHDVSGNSVLDGETRDEGESSKSSQYTTRTRML